MLENSERYPLQHILVEDIFSSNKLIVHLTFINFSFCNGTIWMTHQTRGLISENGQLVLQHQALENEYRNLQLQEATESDNTRVESIAIGTLKCNVFKVNKK